MNIYEKQDRFDSKTGEPREPEWAWSGYRCDFTGVELNDYEERLGPAVFLDYESSDPCYGSGGDEYEFGQEFGIDMHEFLSSAYIYYCDMNGRDALTEALLENNSDSFQHFLRDSRIKTARELIESGEITAEQLGCADW